MTCSVCLDAMDMLDFNDPAAKTESCFKLECGHAYHTSCIIGYLSHSNRSCLRCNAILLPGAELTYRGLRAKLRSELARRPELKPVRSESNAALKEYKDTVKALKAEVLEFINQRISETKLREKRSYWNKTESSLKAATRTIAKGMGPQYVGAIAQEINPYRRNWRFYRELHPYFGTRL